MRDSSGPDTLPLSDGMALALREAEIALSEGEIPVGAALFRGDQLLWADHNRREQLQDPVAHAEMLCLQKAASVLGSWRLSDCTLYVTLEPCPMCAGAAVMARLGKVVFGSRIRKRAAAAVSTIFRRIPPSMRLHAGAAASGRRNAPAC